MPWYVFALVDELPAARPGRGLRGALTMRRIAGGYAVVERRADVPPADFDTLRAHDAVVARIAAGVPAILPVRFGTLLESEELDEALAGRDEEVGEAFDRVRGRVQLTWRRAAARADRPARARSVANDAASRASGTEYLRHLARSVSAPPPAAFRAVRDKLKRFVAAERYQPATASLPESLYHLVDRGRVARYRAVAGPLASAVPQLRLSGPFPPFAFALERL